ncbi:MAG: glutamate--tRNA ligase [Acidobacteria bacterium]|uniref:Glutamate--tRNA ligase n=1 Tax=Candidatus Polarisedimenticola svalbardensis TaxID=2886004 RepID=A0A8J7CDA2_9BACT|nr:glutamate--tRNA ligase [Candidatus Polarisedimenticola svalbardensis]
MSRRPLRVRFAPSPTGSLHLGNARTALINWIVARQTGGTLVLRVEDTDTDRHQEGAESGILEDLQWLGLTWDEGPDVGGDYGPYRQSERHSLYREAANRLLDGGRAYRCFCTPEEQDEERARLKAAGEVPRYLGRCGRLDPGVALKRAEAGEPFALRFRTLLPGDDPQTAEVRFHDRLRGSVTFLARELGDPVMVRRDGRATYNFAVVVDDAAMKIDLVLRGDDHLSNTPRQVLFFQALEADLPDFAHLPMVRGTDGERLSKRHGATSVAEYRSKGYLPDALLNALILLGWGPQGDDSNVLTPGEMIDGFSLDRVSKAPSIFDPAKLDWLSGRHIQALTEEELSTPATCALIGEGSLPDQALEPEAAEWRSGLARLVQDGIDRMEQVPGRAAALFHPGGACDPTDPEIAGLLAAEETRQVLEAMLQSASDDVPTDVDAWKAYKKAVQMVSGVKGKVLFHTIRVALTGAVSGPELDRLVPLIGSGSSLFPGSIPSIPDRITATIRQIDG